MSGGDDIDDYKSTGSVLEKLSLFEKLEQRQSITSAANATLTKSNSITSTSSNDSPSGSIRRNDEHSRTVRSTDKDPGMVSIQLLFFVYITEELTFAPLKTFELPAKILFFPCKFSSSSFSFQLMLVRIKRII